ncbi:hypothetical protein Enr13x_62310 [Stieleria neptunia]|uniref:Uncharacterized protein n=1 Tax=Stieleria neptunia TaxID=2527979 RepID=A0A518HZP3_9BACT|nr:hypothetical protein [Stieleria neptunia]QDV46322.1 hypothetical protein Enr13x_62310 [Stieleria neptunia]
MSSTISNQTSTMIQCLPQGICSWNYHLSGEAFNGETALRVSSEQGSIVVDGIAFTVKKQGVFSGQWTLEHGGNEVASAQKQSVFWRTFDIDAPGGPLLLATDTPFTRCYTLRRGEESIATMRPNHPLTRRGKINLLTSEWDAPTVVFSFWLVVLIWRRLAQSG